MVTLSIQGDWSVTDASSLAVAGTASAGATVEATLPAGTTVTATANATGAFTLQLTNLAVGSNGVVVEASMTGYQPSVASIFVTRTLDEAGYEASAASMSYDQLVKDPASLAGTIVTYQAQVFQYDTNTGKANFIASVTNDGYGIWSDNIWADVDPSAAANVCDNTIIQFWGPVVGPYTYTTSLGGSLTIPEINIMYLTVLSGGC
jgi:hypothetical protein